MVFLSLRLHYPQALVRSVSKEENGGAVQETAQRLEKEPAYHESLGPLGETESNDNDRIYIPDSVGGDSRVLSENREQTAESNKRIKAFRFPRSREGTHK